MSHAVTMSAMSRASLLAALVTLTALAPALWPYPFELSDHLIFWQAGHRVASGESPYPIAPWADLAQRYPSPKIQEFVDAGVGVWVYPPWTTYLFAPFGMLPLAIGLWAVHLAYVAAGTGVVLWWTRLLPWSRQSLAALALVCGVAFEPLVIAAHWGQFTSFLLVGVMLTTHGLRSGRMLTLVLGALLLATKPQLSVGVGLLVLALLLRQRRAWMLAATAASVAIVAATTLALEPAAIGAVTIAANERVEAFYMYSTTWSLARAVAGSFALPLALALIAFVAAASLIAARRAPLAVRSETQVSVALTLALAATPYAQPYDQALLLPPGLLAIALLGRADRSGRAAWLTLAVFALVPLPWLLLIVFGLPSLGILPAIVAGLVLAGVLRDPASAGSRSRQAAEATGGRAVTRPAT